MLLGTIVNTLAILFGAILGYFTGNKIKDETSASIIKGFGLVILAIGIGGSIGSKNPYILIFSLVLGTLLGEGFNLQNKIEVLGDKIKARLEKEENIDPSMEGKNKLISKAFVNATLLFCTGAMAIIGSMNAGLKGDHTMLFTKATLDFISALVLSSSLGLWVALSSISVLLYQGIITILSFYLAPLLTPDVIIEVGTLGSILLMGLGLNLLEVTKLKLMNYIPAVLMPIILYPLYNFIMALF